MADTTLQRSTLATGVAVAFALLSVAIAEVVNRTVPEPYLDEIFHIPQAQAYCAGQWKQWDRKLTTPPGLYLLSVALHKVIPGWLLNAPCAAVPYLRSTNLVLLMCAPHICAGIIRKLGSTDMQLTGASLASESVREPASEERPPSKMLNGPSKSTAAAIQRARVDPGASAAAVQAGVEQRARRSARWSNDIRPDLVGHVVTALPPLWFFGFLYYTDVGSLVMVLGSQLAALNDQYVFSAGLGAASLFFRQTNIIWILFVLFTSLATRLRLVGLQDPLAVASTTDQLSAVLRSGIEALAQPAGFRLTCSVGLPYVPVLVGFGAFIRWNGGIVLGDQANHQVAMHLPQLFYFAAFSTFFGWPALLASGVPHPFRLARRACTSLVGSPLRALRSLLLLAAIVAAVHYRTYEHPFLLADNRHYSFYIWRRVVKVHFLARYLLAPVYLFCGTLWWDALGQTQTLVWMLGFLISTSLTLIPSPLLEPRYFLVPYVLMRLHLRQSLEGRQQLKPSLSSGQPPRPDASSRAVTSVWAPGQWQFLTVEALWYSSINAVTMYIFLMRPYKWPSEVGWQRFMW